MSDLNTKINLDAIQETPVCYKGETLEYYKPFQTRSWNDASVGMSSYIKINIVPVADGVATIQITKPHERPDSPFAITDRLYYGFFAKATLVILPLINVVVVENFMIRYPGAPVDRWCWDSVERCLCNGALHSEEFYDNNAFRLLLQPAFPGYDVVSFQLSQFGVTDLWTHIRIFYGDRFPDFVALELGVRKSGCDSEVAKTIYSKFAPPNLSELAKPYDFVQCSAKPENTFKLSTLEFRW